MWQVLKDPNDTQQVFRLLSALTPAQVADVAIAFEKVGTDWFYIVDSSGGLFPKQVTDYVTRVHLSGLAKQEDIAAVAHGPADAALLGEALMRVDDPEPLLVSLVASARP